MTFARDLRTCAELYAYFEPISARLGRLLEGKGLRVIDMLREWDRDQDGTISRKEFLAAVPLLGAPWLHEDESADENFPHAPLVTHGLLVVPGAASASTAALGRADAEASTAHLTAAVVAASAVAAVVVAASAVAAVAVAASAVATMAICLRKIVADVKRAIVVTRRTTTKIDALRGLDLLFQCFPHHPSKPLVCLLGEVKLVG